MEFPPQLPLEQIGFSDCRLMPETGGEFARTFLVASAGCCPNAPGPGKPGMGRRLSVCRLHYLFVRLNLFGSVYPSPVRHFSRGLLSV